jgi:DNA-binding transcriptional LysR family regulator
MMPTIIQKQLQQGLFHHPQPSIERALWSDLARRPGLAKSSVSVLMFLPLSRSSQPAVESRDFGVVSLNTWRIGDLTVRHKLLLAGLGWSGMPEPIVRADIESGRLVRLNLPNWRGGEYPMHAIHMTDTTPGPAGQWLIGRLATSRPSAVAMFLCTDLFM